MKRRSFLASMLAAGMAPAIGHAGILMPVKKIFVPEQGLVLDSSLGTWFNLHAKHDADGIHVYKDGVLMGQLPSTPDGYVALKSTTGVVLSFTTPPNHSSRIVVCKQTPDTLLVTGMGLYAEA